jgi:two-component system response regulator AtoC
MDPDCTVLVVEDDEAARTALSGFLQATGYRVRSAATGAEAITALAGGPADAVLLDLVLPEPDGFEVLRRARARDARLPIVVLSALAQAEDVVRAMKLGATDYLPKPFEPA